MEGNNLYTKEDLFITILRRSLIIFFLLMIISLIRLNLANFSLGLVIVLLVWFLTTFPFEYFLKRVQTQKEKENLIFYQFFLELILVTIGIHYVGGGTWYGGLFYSFTIIFSHFILPRKRATEISLIANFILFDWLVLLEFLGIIPRYIIFEMIPYEKPLYLFFTVFLINFYLMFLSGALGFFAENSKKRKERVEIANRELDELRVVLEIQIKARTRQIEEDTKNLQLLVEQKTKDLNRKIRELERFNELTKGREEFLIKLEKKAERLKTFLKLKNKEKEYV